MNWYITAVTQHPVLSAVIQFAILGTCGDILSRCVVARRIHNPFSRGQVLYKMAEWSILAVFTKYAFMGFKGFVAALEAQGYLPQLNVFTGALAVSVSMNLQFGLLLVIVHRVLDHLPEGRVNWGNIDRAFYSLVWFWIPAHTVTFMLPKPFQIGLAAVWSLALGLLLGYFNRPVAVRENRECTAA